jgi:DNA-binding protein YbaB
MEDYQLSAGRWHRDADMTRQGEGQRMSSQDFDSLIEQARTMQERARAMQSRMVETEIVGTAAGGAVTIAATLTGSFQSVRIDPEVLDRGQDEVEYAVLSALRDVIAQMQQLGQERMNGLHDMFDALMEK